MPRKREAKKKGADELKREIKKIERELGNLTELQWTYSKRLVKFGFAAWAFGISAFVSSLILINPGLIMLAPPISISLLILAAVAPVVITVAFIKKFRTKIKHLESVRRRLLAEYEMALLRRVRGMI